MGTWHQVNVTFPDWGHAEQAAAARIAPRLDDSGLVTAWFFIRKHPCWRIRYQSEPGSQARVEQHLDELTTAGHITGWTPIVYEPEIHAFGGLEAMTAAHRLFHADSLGILTYLREQPPGTHRREISLMLCSVMMRAARLDWYEQGDAWARVAAHRQPPPGTVPCMPGPLTPIRRLITVDSERQMRDGGPLARYSEWAAAYATAGRELDALATAGRLRRGLRDVLAHHVIFAWNRIGLPYTTQFVLAGAAKTVVFGPDPTKAAFG